MIRVHVICEGQTEELFVQEMLVEPFLAKNILLLPALIGQPGHKGGNFSFDRLLTDVRHRLLGDNQAYCTTFFDFYGLPQNFPGKTNCPANASIKTKSDTIHHALTLAMAKKLGADTTRRFIPFIQMYEFEALLFSDPKGFAEGIDKPELEYDFQQIVDMFDSPEHINDSLQTAPSKRVARLIHGYQKPLMGGLAALEIGLATIRQECHLFNQWLIRLEALDCR